MDGILQVTTTEDPSIVTFRIDTLDCSLSGLTEIDFEYLNVTAAADCVAKLVESIGRFYLDTLLRDREEAKETVQ